MCLEQHEGEQMMTELKKEK